MGLLIFYSRERKLKWIFNFKLGYYSEDVLTRATEPKQMELIVTVERCTWDKESLPDYGSY